MEVDRLYYLTMSRESDNQFNWSEVLNQAIAGHTPKEQQEDIAAIVDILDTIKGEFRCLVGRIGTKPGLQVLTGFLNENMPRHRIPKLNYSLRLISAIESDKDQF